MFINLGNKSRQVKPSVVTVKRSKIQIPVIVPPIDFFQLLARFYFNKSYLLEMQWFIWQSL